MGLEHIESWTGKRIEDETANSEGVATRFAKDDVLFGKLRPYLAKVYLAEKEGMATTEALVMMTGDALVPSFLRHLLLSDKFIDAVSGTTYGVKMPRANWEMIGSLPIFLPPTKEQEHIAAFLDWKTGQIDALIAKKQALIEKLKEKRLAVITQAVTKGLNPAVPLQDSSIWWLGKVPSHWQLKVKLGFLAASERNSFVNGPFGSDLLTTELVNEGVPVIYSGDVKAINFQRKSNKYVTEAKAQDLEFCRVDGGDILLAKVGDPPGDACVYPIDEQSAVVTQDVVRIRLDTGTSDSDFLSFLLISAFGRHLVKLVSVEATRGRFSLADLKSLRFPIPDIQEQKNIARYLKEKLKKAESVISINETAIARLTEYRTALITAATTGQIDVRKVAIPAQA